MRSFAYELVIIFGVFTIAAGAQQQEFEVASVRPSSSDDPRTLLQVMPGGGLRTSGATMKFLISLAYDLTPFQIVDGPEWVDSARFDVIGKTETATDSEKQPPDPTRLTAQELKDRQGLMRPKLQNLLAERFQLRLHRETREQPVYALLVGKSGIRFERTQGDFRGVHIARNQISGERATIEMLAGALANQLRRPVLDRTGLVGTFDFKLEWAPQAEESSTVSADASGPSIFTALQEQLGLRLESTRGSVDVLVVDHVERPSQN